jgi:phenylacetate-CoA ligase
MRLFRRETPPMIFQYNPIDHYIESTDEGELLFTITRLATAAPKVRYNLHDSGGIITYKQLQTVLAEYPGHAAVKPQRVSHFPILYLFGRSDMTVPFYGAKISPADLEAVVNERCGGTVNSFQFGREDGPDGEARLLVRLECRQGISVPVDTAELHACIFDGLKAVSQDFREVTRMFPPDRVGIEVYAFEQGPFADRDIRIKSKYTL